MKVGFKLSEAIAAQRAWLSALNLDQDPETCGTPERVTDFWINKLVSGYQEDPKVAMGSPLQATSKSIVCVRSIPFHSVCPHHLVPFFGTVDLAFEPNEKLLGLGRFERLVAACSRRLILQEQLTDNLVSQLREHLAPKGILCRVRGQHLCFMLTGREPRDTEIVTWRGFGTLETQFAVFSGETTHKESAR